MDSTLETTPAASPSTNVFKPDDIVPSLRLNATTNSNTTSSNNVNSSNNSQFKKCIHHRMSHCGRTAVVQTQQRVVRVGNGSAVITGGNSSNSNVATSAAGNSSSSVAGQQNGGISTQVGIQSQPGLVQPVSAALLADRYLLLDLVDGSSLYKCIDVRSHEELVCKVANNPCTNLLTAHFRLDGNSYVNPLRKVIQGQNQTYLFFSPSEGDLHSYVRVRKRLREPEARRLFRQMCEVVKCCHEQGIVLRDLKLRKFVFADTEKTHLRLESLEDAVVLDNPAEDLLQDKRGCPAYVSPEILKANTTYSGKAADMWSLGVILYTMLIGRYPFNDSEHASLFAKISRGQFVIPECLTSKARCIIRSLLRRDPDERITSEDVFLHPWMTRDENNDFLKSSSDQCVPDLNFDNAS
ncbi:tribbles homolog 2-like [Bradysia coprophila]|uniref:tribbles homolog 2-like n=1 Tax=Bradysia coprophila TaxID=38358 RepID=UPI00187D78E9|nr:tribbles homolog 2-like [Bradysia coprophila]XP_037051320.1 tribbles homolog 2-like [Bradysia coprophila]XP_037051321.1 tribbles homolog 2-like [Bradysia coprophila]XP_037051323.1 tribbles homolog 2-like [Bradysia coprophila]